MNKKLWNKLTKRQQKLWTKLNKVFLTEIKSCVYKPLSYRQIMDTMAHNLAILAVLEMNGQKLEDASVIYHVDQVNPKKLKG